jgi:hypothetical protein
MNAQDRSTERPPPTAFARKMAARDAAQEGMPVATLLFWCFLAFGFDRGLARLGPMPPTGTQVLAGLVLGWLAFRKCRHGGARVAALAGTLVFLFIGSLHFWSFGDRKAFVRSARQIERGMSEEEVARQMRGYSLGDPVGGIVGYPRGFGHYKQVWNRNTGSSSRSYDHCIVVYGADGLVSQVEVFLL